MKIRLHEPTFGEEEIQAVVEVMRSTQITSGKKVREFEKSFGPNAVMCNSGSSANLLAIAALCNPMTEDGLRPGDEVIVSALSWSTTIWPLVQHGLVPVIVDIDPATLNLDTTQLERAIGPRTKAIMPVHVYGNPCDMTRLGDLCNERDLWLIEDCCEALGAEWNGQKVGTFGDLATYSFYFSHHITTGEGGLVVAQDDEKADLIRILRAHGWIRDLVGSVSLQDRQIPDLCTDASIDPKFMFVNAGYNLRCTEMQAAMGLVQLPKLAGFIEARRFAATWLKDAFGRHKRWLAMQRENGASSWFGFPVLVSNEAPFKTDDLRRHFETHGIETRSIICGNIARQPGMKLWPHRVVGPLANADHVMRNGFSIGCHQATTHEACDYIGAKLDDFMQAHD